MLIRYSYDLSDPKSADEYRALFCKLSAANYEIVKISENDAPATVSAIWPIIGLPNVPAHYLSESGAMVWPWVEFYSEEITNTVRGYYLEGAAPLPAAPVKAAPIAKTKRVKRSKRSAARGRSAIAAQWFVNHTVASRQDAADKYKVSLGAVSAALHRAYSVDEIPRNRPGLNPGAQKERKPRTKWEKSKCAARWLMTQKCKGEAHSLKEGANRYGITPEEVAEAHWRLYPNAPLPSGSRAWQAVEWMLGAQGRTIDQACLRFGLAYSTVWSEIQKGMTTSE